MKRKYLNLLLFVAITFQFCSAPLQEEDYAVQVKNQTLSLVHLYEPDSLDNYPKNPVYYSEYTYEQGTAFEITANSTIDSFSFSPRNVGIAVEKNESTLTFTLDTMVNMAIKVNDKPYLFLFYETPVPVDRISGGVINVTEAGIEPGTGRLITEQLNQLIEKNSKPGKNTILYFPSGEYLTGTIYMKDNLYIYLEKGAKISASLEKDDYPLLELKRIEKHARGLAPPTDGTLFFFNEVENAGIYGQGTIDGRGTDFRSKYMGDYRWLNVVRTTNARNLYFEGIYLLDAVGWNTHLVNTDSATFTDVKVINEMPRVGWNPNVPTGFWNNTDGINPDASTNIFIDKVFAYCGDDCITLKITNSQDTIPGNTENIRVTNSMFMSSTGVLKCGTETLGDEIHNVVFKNIYVMDMPSGYPLKLTPRDRSHLHDILFENIYFEQSEGLFLELRTMEPRNAAQDFSPEINGITLRNLYLEHPVNAKIRDHYDAGLVNDITFIDWFVQDEKINDKALLILENVAEDAVSVK